MASVQPNQFFPSERLCAKCGTMMLLARIMPDAPGVKLCTFECPRCNHEETLTVPYV